MEEEIRQRAEELETVLEAAPVAIWIGHDPQSHNITGNRTANEFYEAEVGENVSANVTPIRRYFREGCELTADELPMQEASLKDIDVRNVELDVLLPSGEYRTMLGSASPLHDAKGHVRGSVGTFIDITERKKAEAKLKYTLDNLDKLVRERTLELEKAYNSLKEIEIARKQEIHHRIKNNLQVISSLLDLQAEKFNNRECIKDSEVLEAFRNSQDRVISMALIHEELYKGGGFETLNFSPYIEELAENLLQTYRVGSIDISLKMDLVENAYFDMDTAVPLGIIVNEIVSNSFKHAFPGRDKGEIQIKLCREKSFESEDCKSTTFVLTVSDNGIGIPEDLVIEDLDSLGMKLVTTLVDQLDGELELKRDNGRNSLSGS
jgi:two-component sensor histidine kinase